MKRILLAFVLSASSLASAAVSLPGEPATKPAVPPFPFPDALSACVWRNWFCVPHARLARTIGATPDQLRELGAEMGLPADPEIPSEWRTKGYVTVIRRNWQLLDYDQLCEMAGMTREELKFALLEDDVLYIKLGMKKPKCGKVAYSAALAKKGRAARKRLAAVLAEEDAADFSEEPRFRFIRDISTPASRPSSPAPRPSSSPFDFRLIFSYFSDFGDPLADPEVGSCPEGLLQRLSAQGVNAVWLHVLLNSLVADPEFPEWGEGAERRLENLRTLIARAAKYGVKVYLYFNEPRGEEPDFFAKGDRARLVGAKPTDPIVLGKWSFCTSVPENLDRLERAVERVFRAAEGLGGILTITCSENLTNCASRPGFKETCPRCAKRSRAEVIADANNAMIRGMKRGSATAEALVWNWAWPQDEEADLVARLEKGRVRVMGVSENGMVTAFGGVTNTVKDYSIGVVGPGERAKAFWRTCAANGLKAVAKVQVSSSWELSTYPYLPTMELNARQALNLAREGVDGVMLSWSLGGYPAPNLRVYDEIRRGETEVGPLLDRIAGDLYGADAAPDVRRAWSAFADGFAQYPNCQRVLYFGPQHWGPANPLYPERVVGFEPTMVGIPYDGQVYWRDIYPTEVYEAQFGKVAAGFRRGCDLFAAALGKMPPEKRTAAERELAMFRAETLHFESTVDQSRFVLARNAGRRDEMRTIARRELARAKELLGYVRADSRFGYESSNQYLFTPQDIREKILGCRAILGGERPAVGYMLDVSRDKVPTMGTMRRIVDILARLGYNQLQLYFEHAFAYRGHETVWKDVSPFTPEEIRTLDGWCAEKGIELVPNQNSFGHLEKWFEHPEYLPLAELDRGGGVKLPWGGRTHEPRALAATGDRSFEFLDGLYRQLLPCFRSKLFNVGCDEVHDICEPVGQSADAIREKGEPRVYLDYLKRLDGLVRKHGHTMMYWADGVVNRDAKFRAEVPKDAIALEWAYEHVNDIDAALGRLVESGIPFYVCPGSSNWLSLSGRYDNMKSNVTACVNLGRKHGAKGYLLTDWGDGGFCRPWLTALPSLLLMRAELAGRHPTDAELARAIDRLTGATCGEALIRYQRLDRLSGIPWKYNHSATYTMLSEGEDFVRPPAMTDECLAAVFAEWRAARATLDLAGAPDWIRDGFALMDLMYETLELRWKGDHAGVAAKAAPYRELWLRYNRPGGLDLSVRKNFSRGTPRVLETPAPPSGADDLTVQVVPSWTRLTADAESVRRHVFPVKGCAKARWRGPNALELPARFGDNPIGCAYWDINCEIDLSNHAGIEFDLYCEDIDIFSQIRFYMRSGKGWFSVWPFAPERSGKWCRIRFAKEDFGKESAVAGFDRIGGIRISGWRGKNRNTVMGLANLSYTDAVAKKLTKEEIAARDSKTRDWVKTLAPKKGEDRIYCCHSSFGMGGDRTRDWDLAIRTIRELGMNGICVNLAWAGCAYYRSDVLPVSPELEKYGEGDQLEECLAACRKYGVKLHAWKMCWLTGGKRTDGTVAEAARKAGKVQVTGNGRTKPDALCPSDPEILDREVEAFVELAKKGVDGVMFDHVRHETDTCFCDGCRRRFEKSIGRAVRNWPDDLQGDKALGEKWVDFRADLVSELVRRVSERVRREAPGVILSAAVFTNPASDRLGLGQDWPRWCREGWIDWACPMDYTVSPRLLEAMVKNQKAAIGPKARLVPILGPSLWPEGTDLTRVTAEQVEVLRKAGIDGFELFNYDIWRHGSIRPLAEGPFRE